jgi:DUF4097 and DUF4098 domain-containing protein YvlB
MRIRAAILLSALAVPTLAFTAYAGPATNQQDVTTKVAGHIHELRVDGDVSNVKLTPGNASVVKAHLEWMMTKPELSVSASEGVLTVKVRCNDEIRAANVYVSLISVCVDDLNIVVPAGANLVVKTGNGDINAAKFTGPVAFNGGTVNVSDLHVPKLSLHGTYGVTARRLSAPSVPLVASSGDIVADHVDAGSISMTSSNGLVRGTDLKATTSVVATSSSGSVSLAQVVSNSVKASSSNGTIDVSDLRAHSATLTSSSADVSVRRVTTDRLDVTSNNGLVSVVDAAAASTRAESSSGDVTVQRLRGAKLEATSSNGSITVSDVHLRVIAAHSSSSDIAIQDLDVPDSVKATSSNGDVNVRVPRGSYYVEARSSNGQVHLDGLTLDRRAPREIIATTSSGDISVTGV